MQINDNYQLENVKIWDLLDENPKLVVLNVTIPHKEVNIISYALIGLSTMPVPQVPRKLRFA